MEFKQWDEFKPGAWMEEINVRDFIQKNYTPYEGDDSFLSDATSKTLKLWDKVLNLYKKEREAGGVLDISQDISSTITRHDAGYIYKENEETPLLTCEESSRNTDNEVVCNTDVQTMDYKLNATDNYKLVIEFPEEYNDDSYTDLVDYIDIEIKSWQAIGGEVKDEE